MEKASASIRTKIQRLPTGVPIPLSLFLELGSRAAVDQALSRLVRQGQIKRLARGLLIKPKKNSYVGEVMPSAQTIAESVAKYSGHRIQMHGAEIARKFGLTTQIPVQPIFLTNGPSRTIKVGNTVVKLKRVPERKLGPEHSRASEVISLLWYLGKRELTGEALERVLLNLTKNELRELYKMIQTMPGWMADRLREFQRERENG